MISPDVDQKIESNLQSTYQNNLNIKAKQTIHMITTLDKNLIKVKLRGKTFRALIDTGSTISAISESFLNQIQPQSVKLKTSQVTTIRTAAGTQHGVIGLINLSIEIGDLAFEHDFHVIPKLMQNIIIGMDLLSKNRAFIDFTSNTLMFPEEHKACPLINKSKQYLQTMNEIKFYPKQIKTFKIQLNGFQSGDMFSVEPVKGKLKNLKVAKLLFKSGKNKNVKLPLRNLTNKILVVKPQMLLAQIKRVRKGTTLNISHNEHENVGSKSDIDFEVGDADISEAQKQELLEFLKGHQANFAKDDTEIGLTNIFKHKIETDPTAPPVQSRPYRTSPKQKEIINAEVEKLLKLGFVTESNSPYSSACVLVPKGEGYRLCIDYRMLNSITKNIYFHIPTMEEIIDSMGVMQPKIFSSLDCFSGFMQIEVDEESRHKTAFITTEGLYEFKRMSFGLKNAPFSYQKLMQIVLSKISYKFCHCFIDDIIIFSKTFEQHIEHLREVFRRLKEANIKLKPSKCVFGKSSLTYLGHVISKNGVQCDKSKTDAVSSYPIPKNVHELRSFLGLTCYYRKFVKNYSQIAAPLTKLLGKEVPYKWTRNCQDSFELLKRKLVTAPILQFPRLDKTFILSTDASTLSIGYILSQKDDSGVEKVVCYGGRSLKPCETRYTISELEMLALVEGVKKFSPYLMHQKFIVNTDHRSLTFLRSAKHTTGRLFRWNLELEGYDFEVNYSPNKSMKHVDALSRRPYFDSKELQSQDEGGLGNNSVETIFSDVTHLFQPVNKNTTVKVPTKPVRGKVLTEVMFVFDEKYDVNAMMTRGQKRRQEEELRRQNPLADNVGNKSSLVQDGNQGNNSDQNFDNSDDNDDETDDVINEDNNSNYDDNDMSSNASGSQDEGSDENTPANSFFSGPDFGNIKSLQRKSEDFKYIIDYLENGRLPDIECLAKTIPYTSSQYELVSGVLYHFYQPRSKNKQLQEVFCKQLALPQELRNDVLRSHHDLTAHLGLARVYADIRQKYYFPGMYETTEKYIKSCEKCQINKRDTNYRNAPLHPLPICGVFERWHVDVLSSLPVSSNGFDKVLVAIDSFSHWPEVLPVKDQTALCLAETIYAEIICRYGIFKSLLSDRHKSFLGKIMTILCKMLGIKKLQTSSFHPQTNSTCERYNSSLLQGLRMYCEQNEKDWVDILPAVLMGYRKSCCTENSLYSPYRMVYGKEMMLPCDLPILPQENLNPTASSYLDQLVKRIKITREIATKNTEDAQKRMKIKYDRKTRMPKFRTGDLVYLKQNAIPVGKCRKLYRKYSAKPYYIVKCLKHNTYKLRYTVDNQEMSAPVHANKLKICHLPIDYRQPPFPSDQVGPSGDGLDGRFYQSKTVQGNDQARTDQGNNDNQSSDKQNVDKQGNTSKEWYSASKLLRTKMQNGKRLYLVKWLGKFKPSWILEENITQALIQKFYIDKSQRKRKKRRRRVVIK